MLENRVLRRIFGTKREREIIGNLRNMYNEELHNSSFSPDLIRVILSTRIIIWVGHVTRVGDIRNKYTILVGKPEENRPLETPRDRYDDIIRTYLEGTACEVMDWIRLAQDRVQ
jgi:hypothetical protein